MITAQVLDNFGAITITGRPVKIQNVPPGVKFIYVKSSRCSYRTFCVSCGCWGCYGGTLAEAVENTEAALNIRAQNTDYERWWKTNIMLFWHYKNYLWALCRMIDACASKNPPRPFLPFTKTLTEKD